MSAAKNAVLLVAHGTPDSPADVAEFLRRVTGGRELPQAIVDEIAHRYKAIGRSPLTEITRRQAKLVETRLGLPVFVGMRNWKPWISEAIAEMESAGIQQVIAICMAPQNSRTSVGLYKKAVLKEAGDKTAIDFVESWHDHPLLIRALGEKLRPAWKKACDKAGANVPVIFTAHSVPARTIPEGDPYEAQAKETAALVAAQVSEIPRKLVNFAFQSQGISGDEWLGPTVEETIVRLKQQGHRALLIHPIGFLCDHVEVLYDIDISFKSFAAEQGMELARAESLNDSALLADALADIARTALGRGANERASARITA